MLHSTVCLSLTLQGVAVDKKVDMEDTDLEKRVSHDTESEIRKGETQRDRPT